jgi:uncharacterized protein YodC (DUF2158 family)
MALILNVLTRIGFLPQQTRYKAGDHVQRIEGGALMVVEWVKKPKGSKDLTLACKWFDRNTKQTKIEILREEQVKTFDWYNPA